MRNRPLLIKNAVLVNEGRSRERDVRIVDGRIDQVASGIKVSPDDRVVDAEGQHLLPGMIDDQVHFREPGMTHKGDIATESAAAAAGGITSFMDMPNVKPATTSRDRLKQRYTLAEGRATGNYAFYLGATNSNIDEIRALEPGETCGVKAFMGTSTGDLLVDDPRALEALFSESPVLIATHCEDTPTIKAHEEEFRQEYGEDVPMSAHPLIRSADACYKSSSLAVALAKKHDASLHVLHLTTERELELFDAGPLAKKRITAEVCVHHLLFDDSAYEQLGTRIKCNPAIKTHADQQGLIDGLIAGKIDIIATDHAPHTLEEKNNKYFDAPAGLPLAQHAMLMVLEHVHDQRFSAELAVEKMSHAVAERFGIVDRGYVREGYWADLVLVDMNRDTVVTTETLLSKCGWSPFEGTHFRSTITTTIVNGDIVYTDGVLTGAIPGQRLEFTALGASPKADDLAD
jgi:dihydroorotase